MKTQFVLLTLSLNFILFNNASAAAASSTIHEHAEGELKTIFHCFDPHTYTPPLSFEPLVEEISTLDVKVVHPQPPMDGLRAQIGSLVEIGGPRYVCQTEDGRIKVTKQEPKPENIFATVERGRDGRMRIEHTDRWPHAVHGYLKIMYPDDKDGYYMGTGILVGPTHVLTAGHNIYSHKEGEGWPSQITFIPGRNVESAPFGSIQARALLGIEGWCKEKNRSCDIGMVILSEPIGYQTGWYGLLSGDIDPLQRMLKDLNVNVTGYPTELGKAPYQGTEMWTMGHPLTDLDNKQLYYHLDTSVGQSGSGVWVTYNEKRYIVGIHTYGDEEKKRNLATRINKSIFDLLVHWLKGYYALDEISSHLLSPYKHDNSSLTTPYHPIVSTVQLDHYKAIEKLFEEAEMLHNADATETLLEAADNNDYLAIGYLSCLYNRGLGGLELDKEMAKKYAETSMPWLLNAAAKGNIQAQVLLGLIYAEGNNIKKNEIEALRWLTSAAEKGNANAQQLLGTMYDNGSGVIVDPTEAVGWYYRAAEQDHPAAQFKLGEAYNTAKGVIRNKKTAIEWFMRSANQGYALAEFKVGMAYEKGQGVEKNITEARKWWRLAEKHGHAEARIKLQEIFGGYWNVSDEYVAGILPVAEKGDASAQYDVGKAYMLGVGGVVNDDKEAFKWFRLAAEQEDPRAQYELGYFYSNGKGVGKDVMEAIRWYKLAANQGDITAQYNLALLYEEDEGIYKNEKEAIKWYTLAAEKGHIGSQYNLALMYKEGRGIDKDETEAVKWYKAAAEQGDADAQNNLGTAYDYGKGISKDETEAVKWYKAAAEQGHVHAQYNLGLGFEKGIGVEKNEREAFKWYKAAAEQEHILAQCNLGKMYDNGLGVAKDRKKAFYWWKKAAQQGDAVAKYNIALAYENGNGVDQDFVEAVKWYKLAAEQGDPKAQNSLGFMYENAHGIALDVIEAFKWYKCAAEQGDCDGQYNLARLYKNAIGVSKNIAEALRWYKLAAAQGDIESQEMLKHISPTVYDESATVRTMDTIPIAPTAFINAAASEASIADISSDTTSSTSSITIPTPAADSVEEVSCGAGGPKANRVKV